jgi:hypothetical protein
MGSMNRQVAELIERDSAVGSLLATWSERAKFRIGVADLIERWSRLVSRIDEQYMLSLDDYFNDVDARVMLDDVLMTMSSDELKERLQFALTPLDSRFLAATEIRDGLAASLSQW